jgi:hypothetical protein
MNKRFAVVAIAALISCGGSEWVDPTTGSFTAQDSAEIMGLMSTALSQVQVQPAPGVATAQKNALSFARPADATETVSYTANCDPSGTVALTGSMDANCNAAGACSFNGGLQLKLNTCANANGLVGNGQINIGASGSSSSTTFALHETVQGGISVTRDGVTIGTCGINVTIDVNETSTSASTTISGTICKQAVQQ